LIAEVTRPLSAADEESVRAAAANLLDRLSPFLT